MSTFLRCFMWFMIGDTVGLLTLLLWQGLLSLNKREPTMPVTRFDEITQSPEELAKFIVTVDICEVCVYDDPEICHDHCCNEGIAEYLKQKVEDK